jgi:hypothetical protein
MLLTIAIQTEFFVQSLTEILNFNILCTVEVGTQLLLHGILELESQFKMFMDHLLVETEYQIVVWIFLPPHGDKMISFSNGSQENVSSMKPLIGTELKCLMLHVFCMHVNSVRRTKT